MDENNSQNTTPKSWDVIIVMMILFWPIGLYMLIQKISLDKAAIINGSKAPKIVAIVLFIFGGIWIAISKDDPEIGTLIIFMGIGAIIGGVLIMKKAIETEKLAFEFKKYLNIVTNGKQTKIKEIAKSAGTDTYTATSKIQKMIDLQIFKSAYIDHSNGELILGEKVIKANIAYVSVNCPHCGASQNVVKGTRSICEYCDSAL